MRTKTILALFVTMMATMACQESTPPDSLHLDPFYKKYVDVNGIPLISSHRVPAPDLYSLLAEYFPKTNLQISKHKKVNEILKY